MAEMEAAFFDLDKTVISKSSSLALTRPMYRAGLVSRSDLLRGAYAQLVYLMVGADEKRMDKAKDAMAALTKGWDREQVEEIIREALTEMIDPYIYLEALDLMELHRARGRRVYIVSSSPEEVVKPLAEHLGEVTVIASRPEVEDGKYTGVLEFYAYGESKADAIREIAEAEGIELSGSYAYSDSITDRPMLEAVGHPVAVNPDRDLRKLAEKRGWQIRDFRRPVRLRQRLPRVSAPATQGNPAPAPVPLRPCSAGESLSELLGPFGGFLDQIGGDRPEDRQQLCLQGGFQLLRPLETGGRLPLQPSDGGLEPADAGVGRVWPQFRSGLPPRSQLDDVVHGSASYGPPLTPSDLRKCTGSLESKA
jgi:HAD superfamily hydrolase (TIGR01490 family)